MTPNRSVLIGLRQDTPRAEIRSWVRRLGFRTVETNDGGETVAWLRDRPFAASFVEDELASTSGEPVWRVVRPLMGRRLVLLVERPRNQVWFEALGAGVGAVVSLPPEEPMVRAALRVALGDEQAESRFDR